MSKDLIKQDTFYSHIAVSFCCKMFIGNLATPCLLVIICSLGSSWQ